MSMYLPNSAVHPAQSDPVEFIDLPPMANEVNGGTSTSREAHERTIVRLSPQARIDLTRRARDYVTQLVVNSSGDSEDVRSIIHDLHDQLAATKQ